MVARPSQAANKSCFIPFDALCSFTVPAVYQPSFLPCVKQDPCASPQIRVQGAGPVSMPQVRGRFGAKRDGGCRGFEIPRPRDSLDSLQIWPQERLRQRLALVEREILSRIETPAGHRVPNQPPWIWAAPGSSPDGRRAHVRHKQQDGFAASGRALCRLRESPPAAGQICRESRESRVRAAGLQIRDNRCPA
jgi:hypothetical protein